MGLNFTFSADNTTENLVPHWDLVQVIMEYLEILKHFNIYLPHILPGVIST